VIDFKLSTARRDRTAAMPFIMLTVLIDMVSIGLIIPVLPTLVGTFTGSQADQAFWYGVVVFAFGIANFFGSPVLGGLSDAYGRRPLLLLGFCGLGLNFFATGLATALWMLIAVRLVGGAMQANAAVANAYVADITPPGERARRFGLLGAMFGVGFIVGPVMGGLLGAISIQLPFFVAGGTAMINWLYGYFVLPESLPPERRRPFHWRQANPLSSLRALTQLHGVGRLVAVVALSGLAQFVMFTSWVLYTTFKFGWGPRENGWSLAAVGVMSLVC
jgi:DHA1 family tetracycline resistance protein-like MFS transporter